MLIEQLFEPGLGHASYLCADPDAGVAFVVDPGRDPEPYLSAAARLGVLITHSFETHVHNDYLSGSRALGELRPITVVAPSKAGLRYPHQAVTDGEVVQVGELTVQALATPGHTPEHMAWLVADRRRADEPQYLFSGGALLVGHAARVDLLGAEAQVRLTRAAYQTLRDRLLGLPDHLAVFPTHGRGSSCSGTVSDSRWTTLGFERRHNPLARAAAADFAGFERLLGHELPAAPAYYPHVRQRNHEGAPAAARPPLRQLRETDLDPRAALLDPRPPHIFGLGHRRGALNVVGNDSFGARVGATVPFGTGCVILTDDAEQAERLRGQLARIGYDEVLGYASPAPDGAALERVEQLDPAGARERIAAGDLLLDVRESAEWREARIRGAVHIPYADLRARLAELPPDRAVVAYCASGVRSSLAASLLRSAGLRAGDLRGGLASWQRAGLEVEAG